MTSLSLSQPADGPGLPVSGAAVPAAAQLACARGPGAANDAVSGEAATVSDAASAHRALLLRMPPLVLAVSMAMTHADIWAQPAEHDAAPANAQALGEVRIYATSEKDIGFAPAQAETAGKAPRDILTTPQSVSVVTREQLESRQVNNLQDALQTVAGVSPVNFGRRGFDDIFMRGFRATESVLIDGLVQTPTKWTRLQNYGYERYEVLKGANSVLYGQMQPGGLVNAISKRPRRERMGEVVAEIGNWGYRSLAADYNHPLSESGKTAFRINAVASRSDDPTDQVWRRDRWVAPSLSLDFGAQTDVVLFATYSHSQWLRQQGSSPYGTLLPNANGTVSPRLFTGDPSFGHYDVEQYMGGYNLQHRFVNGVTLRQTVRYEKENGTGNMVALQKLRPNQRMQNRRGVRQEMDYDLLATDTSILADVSALGLKHQVVAGLDARVGHSHQRNRNCTIGALDLFAPAYGMTPTCRARLDRDAPTKQTVMGVYVQDQASIGADWTVVAGLRHERARSDVDNRLTGTHSRQRDHDTTGSVGASYTILPGLAAYASYSQSFLPVAGQDAQGRYFVPETASQREVGFKYVERGVRASVALYDLKRQHVSVSDPNNDGYKIQVGEQRSRGVELEGGLDLGGHLKLLGAYAYTHAEVTSHTNAALVGKPVEMTARHVVALWADWQLPMVQGVSVGLGGRYVGRQTGDVPFSLPSYTLADLSVAYTGNAFKVTAGVKNLFDRMYYAGAINENVVSPGMPRTYVLTLKYAF